MKVYTPMYFYTKYIIFRMIRKFRYTNKEREDEQDSNETREGFMDVRILESREKLSKLKSVSHFQK